MVIQDNFGCGVIVLGYFLEDLAEVLLLVFGLGRFCHGRQCTRVGRDSEDELTKFDYCALGKNLLVPMIRLMQRHQSLMLVLIRYLTSPAIRISDNNITV